MTGRRRGILRLGLSGKRQDEQLLQIHSTSHLFQGWRIDVFAISVNIFGSLEITVNPGEEKTYRLHAEPLALQFNKRNPVDHIERDVQGSEPAPAFQLLADEFHAPHAILRWTKPDGITHLIDRATGTNLLDATAGHSLFGPVSIRGVVDDPSDAMEVFRQRNAMGRNRRPERSLQDLDEAQIECRTLSAGLVSFQIQNPDQSA